VGAKCVRNFDGAEEGREARQDGPEQKQDRQKEYEKSRNDSTKRLLLRLRSRTTMVLPSRDASDRERGRGTVASALGTDRRFVFC
jgi:hypothetical protein